MEVKYDNAYLQMIAKNVLEKREINLLKIIRDFELYKVVTVDDSGKHPPVVNIMNLPSNKIQYAIKVAEGMKLKTIYHYTMEDWRKLIMSKLDKLVTVEKDNEDSEEIK